MPAEVTGEIIKSAIARKITEQFSVDTKPIIYKEQILQGFKKPSFFIWTVDVSQQKQMLNNFTRSYEMNVRYHAEDNRTDLYEHLCSVGSQLLECLSIIVLPAVQQQLDGTEVEVQLPLYSRKLNFKITDDVLQVYVTYDIKTKKHISSEPVMLGAHVDIESY